MQPVRGPPMLTLAGLDPSGAVDAQQRAQSPTISAAQAKAPLSPATVTSAPLSSNVGAKPVIKMEHFLAGGSLSPTTLALALAPVMTAGGKPVFRCAFPGCGREFQLKGNLKRHLNIHSGEAKFRCAFCNRAFLRKADMEVHTRVHTGEKPHACRFQGCGRSFARRSDLLSHERTHTGAKPFACAFPGCDRRFARKFDLHKHQRMHETPAKSKASVTKKRRLASSTASSSPSSSASTPYASPNPRPAAEPTAGARASTTTSAAGPKGAVRQCVQCGTPAPTAAARAAPGKQAVRYELTCTEDHVHSPPACFAALNVADPIDDFLADEDTPDLRSLSLLDLSAPSIGPCAQSGHVFPPVPTPSGLLGVDPAPAVAEPMASPAFGTAVSGFGALSTGMERPPASSDVHELAPDVVMDGGAARFDAIAAPGMSETKTDGRKLTLQDIMTLSARPEPPLAMSSAATGCQGTTPAPAMAVCVPVTTQVAADPALSYARHSRSCGHLSIQHGNHRDYVVQNHLVCQDSVKKLGERSRSGSNCSSTGAPSAAGGGSAAGKKWAPKDSHGPGCGHLPVRHHDHIDYVVEDNLFCQREGWLDDADNIELLDDDFWAFYGAIGSLNPDEQQPKDAEKPGNGSATV